MNKTIKNLSLSLLAAFTMVTAQASAATCCPETDCFSCCDVGDMCGGWSVGIDFLYWHACKNNPDFAVVIDDNNPPVTTTTYKYANTGWDPGFRIRLGKENVYCGWDLSASYTFFRSNGSNFVEAGNNTLVNTVGFTSDSLFDINAKNSLQYQDFDVLMGYEYCFCECQSVKPFFGIQGVRIQQNFDSLAHLTDDEFPIETIAWESTYKALGLELGTMYQYSLQCGLGLFTKASLSLVAGNNDYQDIEQIDDGSAIESLEFTGNPGYCSPGMHVQVGFSFEKCWCDRVFSFHAGYEFQDWWNIPQVRQHPLPGGNVTTSGSIGNLMMHGLFVGMDIGF